MFKKILQFLDLLPDDKTIKEIQEMNKKLDAANKKIVITESWDRTSFKIIDKEKK